MGHHLAWPLMRRDVAGHGNVSARRVLSARRRGGIAAALAVGALAVAPLPASAQSGEPIKIGFSMALTGPLAPNGKQALLGAKIWEEEINAKGGLLGRKVKLINYDDQSNPATVPGIYTKLLDVDKVDLVVGPYATNMIAPAMPVVMQKGKTFIGLFGARGEQRSSTIRNTSRCCRPARHRSRPSPTATSRSRRSRIRSRRPSRSPPRMPSSARNACEGARENAKKYGFKIVYDKTYPPGTTDFSPIIRALQAANADLVIMCSYPLSSVGILRSANELELHAENVRRRHGRAAGDGVQGPARSPKLNGIVNYETWVPSPKMMAPARGVLQDLSGARRRPKASIRSATISAAGATPICRCSARRSRAPRASTTTSSPTICTTTSSRPSWATSSSARTASGPSRAC